MNKFLTEIDGGLPLRLNDLRWIESANAEMFEAMVKMLLGLNKTSAYLYECQVVDTEQGDVYWCSGGFIYFDNEIFKVDSANVVHNSNYLIFVPDITYDSAGDKNFKNSVQHSTYERRKAKLVSVATLPSSYMSTVTDDFITILKNRLGYSAWYSTTLTTANVTASDPAAVLTVSGTMRKKVEGSRVYIILELDVTSDTYIDYISIYLPTKVSGSGETTVMLYNKKPTGTKDLYLIMSAEATNFAQSNLIIKSPFTDSQLSSTSYILRGQIFYETF